MSEWKEIIKAKGKLSSKPTMRTSMRKVPTKPTKKDCNDRLKALGKFLLNRRGIFNEYDDSYPDLPDAINKKFGLTRMAEDNDDPFTNEVFTEKIIVNTKTIPEDVACKALAYLDGNPTDDIQYRNFKDSTGKDWTIGWRIEDEFDDDFAQEDLFFEDVSVMLVVYETRLAETNYPIFLSHRIILWNDSFSDKVKREMITKIDWRGEA